MARTNEKYLPKYGAWAGRPNGNAPDFNRCCEEVTRYIGNWPSSGQCVRKRGHGPGEQYCKQHDPEAVAARRAEADAKATKDFNARRFQYHGRTFYNALKQIAEGHNDARGLAQEVLATFEEGARK